MEEIDTAPRQTEHTEIEVQTSREVARDRSKQKYPKVKDRITCLIGEGDDAKWFNVQVDSRGGKAKGKNKDYFVVKYDDDSIGEVHLDQVPWRHQPSQVIEQEQVTRPDGENHNSDAGCEDSGKNDEEVFVVLIPGNLHGKPGVIEAKRKELENFKAFKVYEEVEDTGQCRIRSGWVITEKILGQSKGVQARLVARGNEEQEMKLRIMIAMTAQYGWRIESSDVTAAFFTRSKY